MIADIPKYDVEKETPPNPEDLRSLPDFAALCSFLTFFGSDLGIHLTFPQLYDFLALQNSAKTKIWETLHVKLLNKLKYRARPDRWEPVLGRFLLSHGLHIDGIQTAAELLLNSECGNNEKLNVFIQESPGYVSSYYRLSPNVRVKTLLCLLETQFDRNQPFKDKANLRSPVDLRFPPLGIDVWGRSYWLLKDSDINIYLYREDHQENNFQLLCESFDDVRGLIEELKEAFSEDEKLESIFKKKQASDRSNLKYQWTNLIQDDVASPELEISKNDEDSVVSPLSQPNDCLKPAITPPPTPTCDQKPTIHSVDMLLAISKIEHSVKTESQENSGLSEKVVSSDRGKTDDQNHNVVRELEVEQKCLDANTEYHIKQECPNEQVLRPEDDCNEHTNQDSESSAVEPCTTVLSKKSRKNSSTKSSELVVNEQDLRRSSRQRKPVQVFNIQPSQSKRPKLPTPVSNSLHKVNNENEKPKKQKVPVVKIHLTANGHVVNKNQKRKKKRHRKKPRKGSNPWIYGTSSSDSDGEDDSFENALMQHLNVDSDESNLHSPKKPGKNINPEWSDAPESDFDPNGLDIQSDADSVTDGRNLARQKRLQKKFESDPNTNCNADEKEEPCQVCFKSHLPDWMLLCDRCDLGHHAMCLSPPLHIIPEGDWFCPRCQHATLISALNETITVLEAESKKRNIWKRMQERLNFVNISMTNILGDDSDFHERKNKKGKVLRNTQKSNVKYACDDSYSDEENEDIASASHSDTKNTNSNTDSGVDGRSQGNPTRRRRQVRPKAKTQFSRPRRVNFREETSEESESVESDYEPLPCRNTRQRQVRYKVSEAFKELDEALEADEKYQEEKQRKLKRKTNEHYNHTDGENVIDEECELNGHAPKCSRGKDLSNILGPDWKEFEEDNSMRSRKKRRIADLSSSSSSEHSNEDSVDGKARRSCRTRDEDFKPSSSEVSESEDDVDSRKHISSDEFEQLSSDNSWLSTRHNSRSSRGNTRKKKRSSNCSYRSRKPVPCFEDSDEGSDRAVLRTRRCTRTVVSYRESNDETTDNSEHNFSEIPVTNKSKIRGVLDDEEEEKEEVAEINKTNADRSPTPISASLKAKRSQSNRTVLKYSSDSDYQPCEDDDDQEEDSQGDSDSVTTNRKIPPTNISIKSKGIIESQSDESSHQHSTSELIISETSDIDNSLFKDNVKSVSVESGGCKVESTDNIMANSFDTSKNHLNGNNYENDEEVEDEADECLPVRNLPHVSSQFDKQIIENKPCVSPDIF